MTKERLFQGQITDQLIVERQGHTGWITFNDPAKHNAVSFDMWADIPKALQAFEDDIEIRSVVLTGAGDKAFVSGANISQFDKLRTGVSAVEEYEIVAERAQLSIQNFSKPLIARINGYCIGGGMNIALCCDIRVASDASVFSIPAARLGLGYRFTAIQNLVRATGVANALEIFTTASKYSAQEAKDKGLIQTVSSVAGLDALVDTYLQKINANAPITVAVGKKMIRSLSDRFVDIDQEEMKALVIQCFESEDYKEGKKAFAEKRQPQFKGR
jgi:enoyl-CoA hydratase/carnithine racemase